MCLLHSVNSITATQPIMEPPFALLSLVEWSALRLSFQVALVAAFFSLPFAIAAGYVLARFRFLRQVDRGGSGRLALGVAARGDRLSSSGRLRPARSRRLAIEGVAWNQDRVHLAGGGPGVGRGQFSAHGSRDPPGVSGGRSAF